jgi:hypothetical protein
MKTPVIEVGGLPLTLLHLPALSWALRCMSTLFPRNQQQQDCVMFPSSHARLSRV